MASKKALIIGITGQDGAYLAKHLLSKGYEVTGSSRDVMASSFNNLNILGIRSQVKLISVSINDFRSVFNAIQESSPDEIYNLAGQTSVGLSFDQPVEAIESIAIGTLNILEVIRLLNKPVRFYNAGSSECFGDTGDTPANEQTPFAPRSPYAVAKSTAKWLINSYRESYGLYACTGILFNHESPLRPERFVTQKIIAGAAKIKAGQLNKLQLGNLDISRDWGWAPEYVQAMWLMMQLDQPDDFVIATGRKESLKYFVAKSFEYFDLDWQKYVEIEPNFFRPNEIISSVGNPEKAIKALGWSKPTDIDGVIKMMCAEKAKLI
ncbi:GDP-mannose 4,6-dehydratase [Polynucleobacter sp. QLW-P1DATA-2]|uniref:GDP-mannose 4,6-dehydratase n=1 Tax=unclassified Polynucleobacter TaxID=2640945 RepID=UPI0008F8B354|nr:MULTISPECIES: GDP-mannose 4,6-dehydratase [unclassified Polynucleobacter]OIN00873.1 GDP-mannose 4,6-dehydratase [Polynucleobacter sp. QLW-P1DATA-2]OIN02441.1 GDP-mannose 4,6-dehydratase [Polynucleobacter sp. MWH-Tro8-2-5-gr]